MARWRLTQKHYLMVPGTQYEYREANNAGRQIRKVFDVPLFLDPDYPPDHNYPGEIIVAYAGTTMTKDIIFTGPPTADMTPLDDEAKKISEEYMSTWGNPSDDMGDEGYTGKLLLELTTTLQSFNATAQPRSAVPDESLVEMKDQMKKLMDMNMALIAKLEPATRRA